MIKTFYHVNLNINGCFIKEFIPRVPNSALDYEDKKTKRICLSDRLEGCFDAINLSAAWDPNDNIIFVHEFYIDDKDPKLIHPEELYENNLVPDAIYSGEHWYLENLKPNKIYKIKMNKIKSKRKTVLLPNKRFRDYVNNNKKEIVEKLKKDFSCFPLKEIEENLINFNDNTICNRALRMVRYDVDKKENEFGIGSKLYGIVNQNLFDYYYEKI